MSRYHAIFVKLILRGFSILRYRCKIFLNLNRKSYVFVFYGEFGYELMNWQGKVRFLHEQNPAKEIVIISRGSCKSLYPYADKFIDIENFSTYKESVADGYFARKMNVTKNSLPDILFQLNLQYRIRVYIYKNLGLRFKIIFCSRFNYVNKVQFGCSRYLYSNTKIPKNYDSDIYYSKLKYNNRLRLDIPLNFNGMSGFSNYILIMRATRENFFRDDTMLNELDLILSLAKCGYSILLMEFISNRYLDTNGNFNHLRSQLNQFSNVKFVTVNNLRDQIGYISEAKLCLFFSQGDLRSHSYLPPLVGKDVFVLTSKSLAEVDYLENWNRSRFTFGGNIFTLICDKEFENRNLKKINDLILLQGD